MGPKSGNQHHREYESSYISTFPSLLDVAIGTIDPTVTYLFAECEKKNPSGIFPRLTSGVRDPTPPCPLRLQFHTKPNNGLCQSVAKTNVQQPGTSRPEPAKLVPLGS